MKKLMCAVAALAAGAAMAVESDIVGYQNKAPVEGYKLIGSVFYTIGNEDESINLGDLKVVGYEGNEEWPFDDPDFEGCVGEYQIVLLNEHGGNDAIYEWYHSYVFEEGWDSAGGYWSAPADTPIPRGQGLWFNAAIWDENVKLVSSGAALVKAYNIPVVWGYAPITIPLARPVELSEIEPDPAYMTNEEWPFDDPDFEGCVGEYQVVILNEHGGNDAIYEWYHSYVYGEGWDPAGGAWSGEHTFEVGDGIWYNASIWDEGYTLNFPGLEDNED